MTCTSSETLNTQAISPVNTPIERCKRLELAKIKAMIAPISGVTKEPSRSVLFAIVAGCYSSVNCMVLN